MADREARYQFDELSGACATIALDPLQRVVVPALFVFVEFNGGSARATAVMACCRPFCIFFFFFFFFFFLFVPWFPSPPALYRYEYLLALLRVCVRKTAVSCLLSVVLSTWFCLCNSSHLRSCCFVPATGTKVSYDLFLFSTYGVPLATFPFLCDLLASHSSQHLSFFVFFFFLSFPFLFTFFLFFFFSFFFTVWLVFFVFSYPVR